MNSLTGLALGLYITIAGVSGAKYIQALPAALAATTVSVSSASGQKVLSLTSVANLRAGEWIVVNRGGGTEELLWIASVGADSVTVTSNLASTHTPGETVENAVYLNSNASATVTGAAVAMSAPAWRQYGNVHNIVNRTSTYTATINDRTITVNATSGAITINLPQASTATNVELFIIKTDSSANAVTVDGYSSETINGATTQALTTQYQKIVIVCDGSTWWIR